MVEGTNLPLKMPVSRLDELASELPAAVLENMALPTAIQQYALPVHLAGRDLAVLGASAHDQAACLIASTIAGVLAAPPSAPRGASEPCRPRALVLVPTRDHAQIAATEARALAEGTALRYALAYGAHTIERSLQEVETDAGLLIATPTRLFDLTERGVLKLDAVKFLVLVGADTLLDYGFTPQVGSGGCNGCNGFTPQVGGRPTRHNPGSCAPATHMASRALLHAAHRCTARYTTCRLPSSPFTPAAPRVAAAAASRRRRPPALERCVQPQV